MTRVFFLIAMLFLSIGCDPNDEIIEAESSESKEAIDLVLEQCIDSHGDEGDSMPDYD